MHDLHSKPASSLAPEKAAYFKWRDSLRGYENFDSYLDEEQQLRGELRITAKDEIEWRKLRESQFLVEF